MKDDTGAFCLGMLAGIVFVCIVMVLSGPPEHLKLKQQAVERGYAEWRLTHAHNGTTEFRWLDKPSPPSPETVIPPQP